MRARLFLIGGLLSLALAGCGVPAGLSPASPSVAGGSSSPSSSPSSGSRSCPLLNPTLIPPGFELAERSSVEAGENHLADIVVYRHRDGRFLAFASGSPGPIGGAATGQRVMVRGHEAEVFREPTLDELAVLWLEASAYEPCHSYSISAGGLEVAEFVEILARIK